MSAEAVPEGAITRRMLLAEPVVVAAIRVCTGELLFWRSSPVVVVAAAAMVVQPVRPVEPAEVRPA